jgi:hypothetical protein
MIHFLPPFLLIKPIRIEFPSGEDQQIFHLGEVLKGTVIEQIDGQHAVMRFKGHDLWVETHLALSERMEGYFKVEDVTPQVILRPLWEEGGGDSLVRSWVKRYLTLDPFPENLVEKLSPLLMGRSGNISPLVRETTEQVLSLLKDFSMDPPYSLDVNHLKEILLRSGLFFESQLGHLFETQEEGLIDQMVGKDLKGLLMKLTHQLNFPSLTEEPLEEELSFLKEVIKSLKQVVQRIEGYQVFNLNPFNPLGKIFLLLPILFQNQFQFVEMELSLPSQESDRFEKEGISILFLLQMPEWKRVMIEVKLREKVLFCRFTVSHPEAAQFIQQAFPDLALRLKQIDLKPHFSVAIEDIEKIPRSLLHDMRGEMETLLNIMV